MGFKIDQRLIQAIPKIAADQLGGSLKGKFTITLKWFTTSTQGK
jgi:hypothetical protein